MIEIIALRTTKFKETKRLRNHADNNNPPSDGEYPATPLADGGASPPDQAHDAEYWDALIPEKSAGAFLGVTGRTMQKMGVIIPCKPKIV